MGFPLRWIDLVMDCILTSTLEFVINVKVSGQVVPSRGLRQGCFLSPYLFLFCAETLSCLLRNSERDRKLSGFRCCRGSPLISHLFFTEDSVLFCKPNVATCAEISRVLKVYQRGSGQMVNLQKSNITFSSNVSCEVRDEIQVVFGVSNAQTHDKYLGLPTLVGKNKNKTFTDIKDKVWKKLRSWKNGLFSFGGQEVVIKAVVQAVPTYTMSIFQLPSEWFIQGSRSDDFWFLVGFKRWEEKNQLGELEESMCSKGVRWKVGDGKSIKAFVDPWIPRPSLFKPITAGVDKRIQIVGFLLNKGRGWTLRKLEQLFLEIDRNEILKILLGLGCLADKIMWHYDKIGIYEVRSGYRVVREVRGLRCGQDAEPVGHDLWWCARSIDVWALMSFWGPVASFQGLSCVDVLFGLAGCLRLDALKSVCMILWGLWLVRNEVVHQGTSRVDDSMVDRLLSSLKDFQVSRCCLQAAPTIVKAPSFWSPPHAGFLKLNTDASVKNGIPMCGIGAVIRDEKDVRIVVLLANCTTPIEVWAREWLNLKKAIRLPVLGTLKFLSPLSLL
ncbi:hypothetical protein Dsin_027197 [Dipteronia sinensis]|uniref:Reverse transcriptase domain-containing protein n=1 Tax=Dipteronia sinensis TaxID=43782 RepID=A0AAE0DYL2_9ROSI|nr:hypothetical protein Dsin_027197 [Dipteronia sinensis]